MFFYSSFSQSHLERTTNISDMSFVLLKIKTKLIINLSALKPMLVNRSTFKELINHLFDQLEKAFIAGPWIGRVCVGPVTLLCL